MVKILVVILISIFHLYSAQLPTCDLNCPADTNCYSHVEDALNCLQSMPLNQEWVNATIDALVQSLQNFGFLSLYKSTGPPYSINLDVMNELLTAQSLANNNKFINDLEFQEYLQQIFQSTLDAHTRYSKPYRYNVTFLQPFSFNMTLIRNPNDLVMDEPRLFTISNLFTDIYK
jgi:hypothetical protein